MSLLYNPLSSPPPHVQDTNTSDDMDPETAALIAQITLEDRGYAEDHRYATSLAFALITDAAYLESIIVAEEAAAHDRLAAEMLARGEDLPPPSLAQMRMENPSFEVEPDLSVAAVAVVKALKQQQEPPAMTAELNSLSDTPSQDTKKLLPDVAEEPLVPSKMTGKSPSRDDISESPRPLNFYAAYLEATIIAEEAAAHDRLAAEILARGEDLPPQTGAQKRMGNPDFIMHLEPPSNPLVVVPTDQLAEKKPPMDGAFVFRSICIPNVLNVDSSTSLEAYLDYDQNASILANAQKSKSEFDHLSRTSGPSIDRSKWVQCTICYDSLVYSKAFQTPCDHNYCKTCIINLVERSTLDETLFPPRCCKIPIPITDVDPYISPALRETLQRKHSEFSILAKDRVYCAYATCSTFLGSSEGKTDAGIACPICRRSTCLRCKQASHLDEDCVPSEATVQLRALAQAQRWQNCPGCGFVVELIEGCYHMTCRCGTQFCYQCSALWKTCIC
ncbi:hypothetical protein BDN70DRAFT_861858 [Pholiota conissans]|uniref:RBR-type E3 ubiquitin transferase n=1 Tax=Pholiota conissans TaxID=109636 RepID=A0A9P6CRU1_9AGAR|nr:hypothetical protein BDN70DRAFT_861858 [Pholiota conissans]